MKIDKESLEQLITEARAACKNAYVPYSNFHVGAAFINEQGKIFSGANVENASYGLTNCAERNAIFAGVKEGNRTIKALVIYTPTDTPTAPCGACRQVIREFTKDALVISVCDSEEKLEKTISELLPESFGPENLK